MESRWIGTTKDLAARKQQAGLNGEILDPDPVGDQNDMCRDILRS